MTSASEQLRGQPATDVRYLRNEDADPNNPFTQGLRQRYKDLANERQALLVTIAELESQDAAEPEQPSVDQLGLLDALPHLTVNLDRAPAELLEHCLN